MFTFTISNTKHIKMETLQNPKETRAIKKHYCDYCGVVIRRGQKYMRSTHVHAGEIYTWKSHMNCNEIADLLNMFDDCYDGGLSGDEFLENVYEVFNEEAKKLLDVELKHYEEILDLLNDVNITTKISYLIHIIKSKENE